MERKFKHKLTNKVIKIGGKTGLSCQTLIGNSNLILGDIIKGEDWEEVVEKDYEILSWEISGRIVPENPDLFYNIRGDYSIHSVKRLSDGEIFTIGDKIRFIDKSLEETYPCRIIKKFKIKNNILIAICDNNGVEILLENLKQVKQPLFTTEDGVDIFEGDSFYNINNKDWLLRNIIKINLLDYQTYYKNQINFSTKEKAEEYILMNKPCLSINDILFCKGVTSKSFLINKAINLAKQKLNNNK